MTIQMGGNGMKRRVPAMILALSLLLTLPVFAAEPDQINTAGALSFESLSGRLQSGNAILKAYDELIAAADAVDQATAYDDLVESINGLSDVIWAYVQAGDAGGAMVLKAQQEQLIDQLDAYRPENYGRTYGDLVRPVQAMQDRLMASAESLYLNLAALDLDIEKGRLQLAALERTADETQTLQSLGRVSSMTCLQADAARSAAQAQLDILVAKSELGKAQLQILIGEAPTGSLVLAPVPEVDAQLALLSYDADLSAGMEHSYDLYAAQSDAADAKKAWEDAESGYQKRAAEHRYQAAVYTYEAGKQSFAQAFDAVYRGVGTAQSSLSAAQDACDFARKTYDAAALRYSLGLISKSALQNAASELALAELAVQSAQIGLASACNSYCWARLGLLPA